MKWFGQTDGGDLPAFSLDVVHVGVIPDGHRCDYLPNIRAVFDNCVAYDHVFNGHLVADGYGRVGFDGDGSVVIQNQGVHVLASLNAFNNNNGDAVFFFV